MLVTQVPAATFVDLDDAKLIYSARWNVGAISQQLPSWLNFDPSTRIFTGTPTVVELLSIRIDVSDRFLGASVVFILNCTNVEPKLVGTIPNIKAKVGQAIFFQINDTVFYDADDETLTWSAKLLG
eukprot:gene21151-7964_t